ncbi:hypothetical protein [Deinococcus soli (ex Cha et al. 2016)]|uniref:Uncharacterized protein n=2 Tax=Deinococcus soli (ex Cha et al. 2016) TaxID=1309411 RepID=A0AAE4BQ79_9DEIO|nr:hypothetical protein [Deinococcus soli (ex Cha et al. 2016)]MDR6220476.1 hypothetical protein [Deinococcus soli (ex Cha et al. 2016)]MDR6330438.1 hypothetical protein [Deinococcus soli (ex Cha et al. 2016)]MDR6753280.1 hypothetical protein [Deinococcus soli (ex Cha et al. 2016)]
MRLPTLLLPLLLGAALAAPAPTPVQPGQTWTLSATTFDGEVLSTALRLTAAPPAPDAPGTYRADRGSLLVDVQADTLIALDLKDAREGGLGLACALRLSTLGQPGATGVLASGPLTDLPAALERALAVLDVARTPQEQADAARELRLGQCTLTLAPTP